MANFFFHCQGSTNLQGAIFATQRSIMGAVATIQLDTGDTALQYRLVSAHFAPDGSLMRGSLLAILPLTAITRLFPSLTTSALAAASLQVVRTSPGDPVEMRAIFPWGAALNGTEGVAISVSGIGFSTPTYQASQVKGSKQNQASSLVAHLCGVIATLSLLAIML